MKNFVLLIVLQALVEASTEVLSIDEGVGVLARTFVEATTRDYYESFQSECLEGAEELANYGDFSDKLLRIESLVCRKKSDFINSTYCSFIEDFKMSSRAETFQLLQILDKTVRDAKCSKAFNKYMKDFQREATIRLSNIRDKLMLQQNEAMKICFFFVISRMGDGLYQKLDERFHSQFNQSLSEFSDRLLTQRKVLSDWKHQIVTSYNECLKRPDYRDCLDNYAEEPEIRKISDQFGLLMKNVIELTEEQIENVGPNLSGLFELVDFDEVESSYDRCNGGNN